MKKIVIKNESRFTNEEAVEYVADAIKGANPNDKTWLAVLKDVTGRQVAQVYTRHSRSSTKTYTIEN